MWVSSSIGLFKCINCRVVVSILTSWSWDCFETHFSNFLVLSRSRQVWEDLGHGLFSDWKQNVSVSDLNILVWRLHTCSFGLKTGLKIHTIVWILRPVSRPWLNLEIGVETMVWISRPVWRPWSGSQDLSPDHVWIRDRRGDHGLPGLDLETGLETMVWISRRVSRHCLALEISVEAMV